MITSSMEIITPEKAAEYLKKNTNNYRSLSKAKVAVYAEDIRNGNWEVNGESIIFDSNGVLKDGQHRLSAVVKADKPIFTLVVRGVDNHVSIMDAGMQRTISQMAKSEGIAIPNSIIGAGNILFAGWHQSGAKSTVKKYILEHFDDLRTSLRIVETGANHALGRKTSCCTFVYCIRRLNLIQDDILEEFFWIFNNQNIKPGTKRNPSPALVAARQFRAMALGGSGTAKKQQASIVLQGLKDFNKNNNRIKSYNADNDAYPDTLLNKIREMDGIRPLQK